MTEGEDQTNKRKEAAVLSEVSLLNLAKEVRQGNLQLFMMLNIPTGTIVNQKITADEQGLTDANLSQRLLQYWRQMRETAKDKDRVADLERALRETGQGELADIVVERNRLNMELTPEIFRT